MLSKENHTNSQEPHSSYYNNKYLQLFVKLLRSMDCNILLRIKDPQISHTYLLMKRKNINLTAVLLLLIRLSQIIYRVIGYDQFKHCVTQYYFLLSGIGINIIALLMSLKWNWGVHFLSSLVILSMMNVSFCEADLNENDNVAVILDSFTFDFACSVMLSYSWIPTIISSAVLKAYTYNLFVIKI